MEKELFKNEFAPYEQALELKELGFDKPCFGWFTESYLRIGGVVENKHIQGENELLAPTFSQAFRWFRDKYGLSHTIHYTNKKYTWLVYDADVNFRIDNAQKHEEAELLCLKQLIEIAKTKK